MSKFNKKRDWWNSKEETDLHYIEYKIKDITIQVGCRPNAYGMKTDQYNKIDGFINVSERFVSHRNDKVNIFIPWNEGGNPTFEAVWAFLKTMHSWVNENNFKNIYIHCDSGTHRAVTMFGLFLHAFYREDKKEILKNHKLVKRNNFSDPEEYSQGYMNRRMPLLKKFVENIQTSIENDKNSFSHGIEISEYLKDLCSEEELAQYHSERFFNTDIKAIYYHMKQTLSHYRYYIFKRPFVQLYRRIHKKLGTKKGKTYEKFRL